MYYLLNDIALRSFWKVPYSYYVRGISYARSLKEEEFNLLKKCDGHTLIEESDLLGYLLERKLIKPCEKNESLTKWQEYKDCDNRYMPTMNLQITGRCNYNCKHCFNAKDNAPLQSELSLEEVCQLLDECDRCGVSSFTITGGEPLAHPHYKEIIEEIYKREMFVFDLNTNGYFITQEMLDWMKSINYYPLIKISFDGLGVHNWMRGYYKAEEKTLTAIKLCIDNGFKVKIQMNINKKNQDVMISSCELLDKMGVKEIRLINTTPAPRWEQNGKQYTYTIEEYFDVALDFLKEYYQKERSAMITFWQICAVESQTKYYTLAPVACEKGSYRASIPLCKGARGMIAIGSNGNVYPCLQSQGKFDTDGIYLGNVKKQSLQEILQDSDYMNFICGTVGEKRNKSKDCHNCQHFEKCLGGCPALSYLYSGGQFEADKTKCIFFNKNYEEKYRELFASLGFKTQIGR